jgi:hypothetical protein
MRVSLPAFLLLLCATASSQAQTATASVDGLAPFNPLVGVWKGEWQYKQSGEQHSQERDSVTLCVGPSDTVGGRKGEPRFGWLFYTVPSDAPGRVPGKTTVQVKELSIDQGQMKIDVSSQVFDRRLLVTSVDDNTLKADVWVMYLKGNRGSGKPSTGDATFTKFGGLIEGQGCPSADSIP